MLIKVWHGLLSPFQLLGLVHTPSMTSRSSSSSLKSTTLIYRTIPNSIGPILCFLNMITPMWSPNSTVGQIWIEGTHS